MRRRRTYKHVAPSQNLDSFLDILTNTVGVLMFISLFVTLIPVEAEDVTIRTPLVSESEKNAYYFEVRDNRIAYLDKEDVDRQLEEYRESLPQCYSPNLPSGGDRWDNERYLDGMATYNSCIKIQAQQWRFFEAETPHYTVEFDLYSSGLIFKPNNPTIGEDPDDLALNSSEYQQILERLDPTTDYLAFLVRPDSFEAFRQAREVAWQAGFDVGWEPLSQDRLIGFGSGGRSIGVQ